MKLCSLSKALRHCAMPMSKWNLLLASCVSKTPFTGFETLILRRVLRLPMGFETGFLRRFATVLKPMVFET